MNFPLALLLITSSIGSIQSGFFGLLILSKRNQTQKGWVFLGLLFIVLAIRMTKTVAYYFTENHQLFPYFENLGFMAHSSVGPFLFLYLKKFIHADFEFEKKYLLHFIPAGLILLLSPQLTDFIWVDRKLYVVLLYQLGLYFPFCFRLIIQNGKSLNPFEKKWLWFLTIGLGCVWLAYVANSLGLVPYISAAVVFTLASYVLLYLVVNNPYLLGREAPSINKEPVVLNGMDKGLMLKLIAILEKDKPYLNPGITMPQCAKLIQLTPHRFSQLINQNTRQNFLEFINNYRVEEAKNKLRDPQKNNLTIASIAYEVGFQSLSTFNAAFKKRLKMTPSEYRNSTPPLK